MLQEAQGELTSLSWSQPRKAVMGRQPPGWRDVPVLTATEDSSVRSVSLVSITRTIWDLSPGVFPATVTATLITAIRRPESVTALTTRVETTAKSVLMGFMVTPFLVLQTPVLCVPVPRCKTVMGRSELASAMSWAVTRRVLSVLSVRLVVLGRGVSCARTDISETPRVCRARGESAGSASVPVTLIPAPLVTATGSLESVSGVLTTLTGLIVKNANPDFSATPWFQEK